MTGPAGALAPVTMAPIIPVSQDFEVTVRDIEWHRTVSGQPLLARIYQPAGTRARAAVLDVHGGAWVTGDRTTQQNTSQAICASGVLVVAIDFRQPPGAQYPASIADANLGARWLKLHAAELGAAPGVRFGAYGGSSGGHVVILSAMRPRDPRYAAHPLPGGEGLDAALDFVITDAPVTDPQAHLEKAIAEGRQSTVDRHHMYWPDDESPIEGNPARILERREEVDLPPLFISQGGDDIPVPLEATRKFAALYEAAGGRVELLTFPGLGHGFILREPARPESIRQAEAIRAFIRNLID
jgi:acetyl esterase/lipase